MMNIETIRKQGKLLADKYTANHTKAEWEVESWDLISYTGLIEKRENRFSFPVMSYAEANEILKNIYENFPEKRVIRTELHNSEHNLSLTIEVNFA